MICCLFSELLLGFTLDVRLGVKFLKYFYYLLLDFPFRVFYVYLTVFRHFKISIYKIESLFSIYCYPKRVFAETHKII